MPSIEGLQDGWAIQLPRKVAFMLLTSVKNSPNDVLMFVFGTGDYLRAHLGSLSLHLGVAESRL